MKLIFIVHLCILHVSCFSIQYLTQFNSAYRHVLMIMSEDLKVTSIVTVTTARHLYVPTSSVVPGLTIRDLLYV